MELIFSLKDELTSISDPRVLGRTRHNLLDILIISTLAIICQAETWVDIECFARGKEEWLRKFLELPNGIPIHDTISRVFSLIEPLEFEKAFIRWVNEVRVKHGVEDVLCIDGKVVGGTIDAKEGVGRKRLNLVSVWSTYQGLVLGQMKAKGGGHAEIATALDLLELINIENTTIVGDAGIGRKALINKIVEKKGDYIFPLKSNSKSQYDAIKKMFDGIAEKESKSQKVEAHSIAEKLHGRREERYCTVIKSKYFPDSFNCKDKDSYLKNLRAVGRIVYESKVKETRPYIQEGGQYSQPKSRFRTKREVRFFVTSLDLPAKTLMEHIRLQWSIENKLHWVLDVGLNEDGNRTRTENLALVRKIAINLAKQDKQSRHGVRTKLKRAGWDNAYLERLIFATQLT